MKTISLLLLLLCNVLLSRAQTCFAGFSYAFIPGSTTVQFYDSSSSTGIPVGYSWTFGDGTSDTLQNPAHTYNASGTYLVCLTINTISPVCTSTFCDTVVITSGCSASFNYSLAGGGTVNFMNYSAGPATWQWWFGDGTFSALQNPSHTYAASGNYTACLIMITSTCSDTTCYSIYVPAGGPGCNASFTALPDTSTGNGFYFNNLSTGGIAYFWDFGDGTSSTLFNPYHNYSLSGTFTVCLYITDSANNCTSTFCDSVVAGGSGCNASFNFYNDTMLGVSFVNTSSFLSPIVSVTWDFGDSTSSTQTNPYHQYAHAGYYNICITITTASGCSSTYCGTINVLPPPGSCQANFSVSPSGLLNTYVFTNLSIGGTQYYWDFGDGTSSTQISPTHTYAQSGYYLICLSSSDSMQYCFSNYCDTLVNGTVCNTSFWYIPDSTVANEIYFFGYADTSSGAVVSWLWDFGDSTTSALQNPVHQFAQSGYYYVCLTITTSGGCTSTSCNTIYVSANTGCQAYFTYTAQPGTTIVDFTNQSGGIVQSFWDFGDGTTSTLANPQHIYSTAGTYLVCLTIADSSLMCTSTYCDTVVSGSGSACGAGFQYSPDTALPNNIFFYGTATPAGSITSWQWDFGDSTFSSLQNPAHLFPSPGAYFTCLTITTTTGCISSYCGWVYVSGTGGCQAAFTASQNGLLNVITFVNQSSGGNHYLWSFGDGFSSTLSNPVHTYNSSGYYYVCLTISDSLLTCSDMHCDTVYIPSAYCYASFAGTPDTSGYGISFTDLSFSSGNITSWLWDFGDSTYSTLQNPFHIYTQTGQYIVCLTIATDSGCTSTLCNPVTITGMNPCTPIFGSVTDSINDSTYFYITSNCGYTTVIWNFGDSTVITANGGNSTTHFYLDSGWYYVCVTVINPNGTYTYCDSVYVHNRPSSGINGLNELLSFVTVLPNPVRGTGNVKFNLKKAASVKIVLYDMLGNNVRLIADQKHEKGTFNYRLDFEGLRPGIYLLKFETDSGMKAVKISVNN